VAMPNKGNKHTCSNCESRYFDFLKPAPACPKCGTVDQLSKGKSTKTAALKEEPEEVLEKASAVPNTPDNDDDDIAIDLDIDDDEDDDDEDEDSLMEDTSDLGSVEDDVHEVLDYAKSPDSNDG